MSEAQRNQLGAPYTPENSLGGGNWRQFFQGGTVEWKNNGTGEVKFTSFAIGSNGSNINVAFTNKFNEVDGWVILGNSIGNVRAITSGTVQDFERGSIFQSAAGTFSLQGTLNNFYKNLSATDKLRLGLPTGSETSAGGYWHQSFQNGELQLVQGVPVKWSSQILISDRYSILDGVNKLGAAVGKIRDVNGVPVQDYQKGSIFVNGNSAVAVSGLILTYYRANSALLGLPIGEEIVTSYGNRQEFQNATVMFSPQFGVQIVRGSVGGYFRSLSSAQQNQLGAAFTAEAVGGDGNWQQFFKGGTVLWKSNGTGEVKFTSYTIGGNGNTVNPLFADKFNAVVGWDALGNPTGNVRTVTGGTVQDFEKGSIFQSAAGTFAVRGSIGVYYRANSAALGLGLPTSEDLATSYGWRQDFQGGTVIHSPQYGSQLVKGSLGNYYRGLSESQRNLLGAPYTPENSLGGGNWRQFFKGGIVEWRNNGTGEVKFTPYSIGLNGNIVNQVVLDKFNQANGWETLGNPLNALQSYAGGLVQDFEHGIIFQSVAGTFVARGVFGDLYRTRFMVTGLPTGDEVVTSFGVRQNFGNKIAFSTTQFGTQILLDKIAGFYNGLTAEQKNLLGAPSTAEKDLGGGNSSQVFQGGIIEWKSNGTGELKLNSFAIYTSLLDKYSEVNGSVSLGKATGNLRVVGNGTTQDFEKGNIFASPSGIFAVRGEIGAFHKANFANLGIPVSEQISTSKGFKQDFEKGIIFSSPNGISALYGDVAKLYLQIPNAGVPVGSVIDLGGGNTRQNLEGGAIFTSQQYGTHALSFRAWDLYKSLTDVQQKSLGIPITNPVSSATGTLQEFQNGFTNTYSNYGDHTIDGKVGR